MNVTTGSVETAVGVYLVASCLGVFMAPIAAALQALWGKAKRAVANDSERPV
ncbi:MAG: hypothetical protein WCE30_24040 [Mycobacterium sp.]